MALPSSLLIHCHDDTQTSTHEKALGNTTTFTVILVFRLLLLLCHMSGSSDQIAQTTLGFNDCFSHFIFSRPLLSFSFENNELTKPHRSRRKACQPIAPQC